MKRVALILLGALAGTAWAGTIYEWKDPQTGKLIAGDKPPGNGVKYWKEGQRNAPDPVMYTPPASTYEKYTVEDRIRKCSNGDTLDGEIGMSIEDFQEYCRAYDFLMDRKETVTAYGKAVTLTYRKVGGEKYDFEYFYFINGKLSSIHK